MAATRPQDLLLAPRLTDTEVTAILVPYGFQNCRRADANLQAMAEDPVTRRHLAGLLDVLLEHLAASADPDQALDYFERFAKAGASTDALLSHLEASPATMHVLTTIFGSSPFLSQILIRNPEYLHWASSPEILDRVRNRRDLEAELAATLRPLRSPERRLDALRRLKRRELLAIGVRDLLRKATVEETTAALSVLAAVVIEHAHAVCRDSLRRRHGEPRSGLVVLAMGKLGGGELNFSSDVDLLYVCGADSGMTAGTKTGGKASRIPAERYFLRLAQELTAALSDVTNEGYLFRVDLRLRPEGKVGRIVESLQRCRRYYRGTRGQVWERLALIKAGAVAGDKTLGRRFLAMVQPFIYQTSSPAAVFADVRRIKGMIDEKMAQRGQAARNVKLGTGGIREIEFLIQALQVVFGRKIPAIRERNTVQALGKLLRARLISSEERRCLIDAYWFLRDVEHKLQMVEEQQTHTVPADLLEIRRCALRMGYRDGDEAEAQELFLGDYARHTALVREVFTRVLGDTRSRH